MKRYDTVLKRESQRSKSKDIKDRNIKLIDRTIIILRLSMFNWAMFRTAKGDLKSHIFGDDNLQTLDLVIITEGKTHNWYGIGQLVSQKEQLL